MQSNARLMPAPAVCCCRVAALCEICPVITKSNLPFSCLQGASAGEPSPGGAATGGASPGNDGTPEAAGGARAAARVCSNCGEAAGKRSGRHPQTDALLCPPCWQYNYTHQEPRPPELWLALKRRREEAAAGASKRCSNPACGAEHPPGHVWYRHQATRVRRRFCSELFRAAQSCSELLRDP